MFLQRLTQRKRQAAFARTLNKMSKVEIEAAVLFLDHVVVFGWARNTGSFSTATITIANQDVKVSAESSTRFERPDVFEAGAAENQGEKLGFIFLAPITSTLQPQKLGRGDVFCDVAVSFETAKVERKKISLISAAEASERDFFKSTRHHLEGLLEHSKLWLQLGILRQATEANTYMHIDQSSRFGESGLLVKGWAKEVISSRIYLIDESLTRFEEIENWVTIQRPDVTHHLKGEANLSDHGHSHGFCFFDIVLPRAKYLAIEAPNYFEVALIEIGKSRQLLRENLVDILDHLAISGVPKANQLSPLMSACDALPHPKREVELDEWVLPPSSEKAPEVSVIIPFFADSFFIFDHIEAQSRCTVDAEWIIVCDDPNLLPVLYEKMTKRRARLKQPTRFIGLKYNVGFAGANNAGAEVARGDKLLFMNSDIYVENFSAIKSASTAMNQDASIGLVGFSLMFEDGSVQHAGMRFEQNSYFHNLWVTSHPGKGLPAHWNDTQIKYPHAVTGALMMLRRSEWQSEAPFDESYIIGDFEDGDLCLRLYKKGSRIALIEAPGLYHLERQSFSALGAPAGREALTYMNCLRMNNRWGTYISELFAHDTAVKW